MSATVKMKAFGVKSLAESTGHSLSILYRWMKAIDDGTGIRDVNKRKLIAATAKSPHALTWTDFEPEAAARPDAA